MARRHKRAAASPPRIHIPPALDTAGESVLKQQRHELPRDAAIRAGETLPAPVLLASWEMRPGARPLNLSELRDGVDTINVALGALVQTNDPATLFQRYGRLTRVLRDENGLLGIADVTAAPLRGILLRAAEWQCHVTLPNGRRALSPAQPPNYVVQDIASHGEWPFPGLSGVSTIPILHWDGTLALTPGYDRASGYWYSPGADIEGLSLPACVSATAVHTAVELLRDWLIDFPFAGETERVNAIALLLTLLARPLITGNVPLALVEATKPRTGKTLLMECLLYALLGTLPALTSVPTEEAEMRKLLASYALHGKSYLCFDNINGRLDSAALASLITTGIISDRLLKTNDAPDMRAGFILVGTANALEASSELLARSYRIKLDAEMSRPQDRGPESFRHPYILVWTKKHRADIIAAGYMILLAYLQAGQPIPRNLPHKGGFEQWVNLIGGALAHAGISGFLSNEHEFAQSGDDDSGEIERFFGALLKVYDHTPFRIGDMQKAALNPRLPLAEALPTELAEVVAFPQRFYSVAGKFLRKHSAHYGSPDMWLTAETDTHTKTLAWVLHGGDDTSAAESIPPEETTPLTREQNQIARRIILEGEGAEQ